MSTDAWITLGVTIVTVVALALDKWQPALVMGAAVTALLLFRVIDQDAALKGFASDAPITVAALYILAGAAEVTGALDGITSKALGTKPAKGERPIDQSKNLVRVLVPSAALSAFIANTPLVGMIAPRVLAWCRRTGRHPSRYLMPLSYAIIFGGCTTLIGTSTNLVVNGLLRQNHMKPFSMFEFSIPGIAIAIAGVGIIILLAPRLLPERSAPTDNLSERIKEFTVEMEIVSGSPLDGATVESAGLRALEGVFLVEIERQGHALTAVGPAEILRAGDRLTFAGNVGRIVDLERIPGLVSAQERHFSAVAGRARKFFEVVLGEASPLVGSTLKESGFRSRYAAAVVAVHRSGERVPGKLGDVRLRNGDVLLVIADQEFRRNWSDNPDFLAVAPIDGGTPIRRNKARIVQLLALVMIVAAATSLLSLLEASLLVAIALIGFKVITPGEARRAVDMNVILLMATSFGLGIAMEKSGLAKEIAHLIVRTFHSFGDIGLLGGILLSTMLLTELLSNNAAAILTFPIAMSTATEAGLHTRPFAVIIVFGATLSFLTPIGYQANTLVWGMGGYKYGDFSRLGAPLTLATFAVALAVVPIVFPLR